MKRFSFILAFLVVTISTIALMVARIQATPNTSYQGLERDSTREQIIFLERIVEDHPTYFSAYVELTKLYLKEGNSHLAKQKLFKAKEINPNSLVVKNYEQMLGVLD